MMIVVIMTDNDNDKKIMRSMISTLISWWRKIWIMLGADGWLWMMMEMNDDDYSGYSMSMMLK
jgi:hypothetical protein